MILLLSMTLFACADKLLDDSANAPSFEELDRDIFTRTCAGDYCHSVGGSPNLDGEGDYEALVNAESPSTPGRIYVVPFDPEASYLIHKLEGRPGIDGTPMPPWDGLPQRQTDRIIAWINAGALP